MKKSMFFLGLLFVLGAKAQVVGTPYVVPINAFQTVLTFNFTAIQQSWVVPSGVTTVTVELLGAQGGGTNAGRGGRVMAQLTVTPGSTLILVVGGQPTNANAVYGGGGIGGSNGATTTRNGFAGGGLAGIYLNSISQANTIAIAGGGGGNSGLNGQIGGEAGAPNGSNGGQGNFSGSQEGGRGGTQSAGGSFGVGVDPQTIAPLSGTALNGGRGGSINSSTWTGGGGGGAGYFGGGGGAGGGSSVGAGGGGSSFVNTSLGSNIVYSSGFNTGNGRITISY
ncbi:glycine-rich protein [Flavobacterium sp.]|uniref:glycine-rich protein n=1 Tax=Flavobacterium sp. TaxID=239 RepID=UPI002614071A|nr:glycine-rich protein [Flavobacterium sp.]